MKRALFLLLLLSASPRLRGETVTVTAYCPCTKCCGRGATGLAANGKPPVAGVTVAGPRRYPLGTKIHIAGLGDFTITDRLAKRFDNRVDVFFNTHAEAQRFGVKHLEITLLK